MTEFLDKETRKLILDERQAWRNVFSSPSGKVVFRRLVSELYFFNDNISPDNIDSIGKNNYFKTILERLGIANDPSGTACAVADGILDALLKLPLTVKDEADET